MESNHLLREKKWQDKWESEKTFFTNLDDFNKPKSYVLDMFPYPSGAGLHVGHPKGYTATDIISRFMRMEGYNVLHPIGWDAFGLPAEQFALTTGNHPADFTLTNIANFRKQLKSLGISFDYSKEVNTTDPAYYRNTQWIFKKLYEKGLASLQGIEVNFCPELGTVLANEEIEIVNGKMVSERGGYLVIKKTMQQWVLKITHYAERLLQGLDDLDWPSSVKELQRNWIGKSQGALIDFAIDKRSEKLQVFTTRPDTIFGTSFIALAPEHSMALTITNQKHYEEVKTYIYQTSLKNDLLRQDVDTLKSGVFTGSYALHPFNNELIPIWIADFVLPHYGTAAVMGVAGHDERDYLFARHHGLEIKNIISKSVQDGPYLKDGPHINSDFLNGANIEDASHLVIQKLEKLQIGIATTFYKLRDWIFARQRYWGEPFPVIHWNDGTISLVDDDSLPVILPSLSDFHPQQDGQSPLSRAPADWLEVKDEMGRIGKREINTMPQWAGSCWYYLAYLLKKDDGKYYYLEDSIAQERFKHWLPVDLYIGGQEHAVLHLLYARFWHHVLYDLNIVPVKEPFLKLINQGMILGENNEKMSKSRGNVINPDNIIQEYGADALRLYEMFIGPLTASTSWNNQGVEGAKRFIDRIFRLFNDKSVKIVDSEDQRELIFLYHQTLYKVKNDYEALAFNTAIAQLMIFINYCYKCKELPLAVIKGFLLMINPIIPHLASEIWLTYFPLEDINTTPIPTADLNYLNTENVTIGIQFNGKLKTTITIDVEASEAQALEQAFNNEKIKSLLVDFDIIKTIYIKGKIINFVIKNKKPKG